MRDSDQDYVEEVEVVPQAVFASAGSIHVWEQEISCTCKGVGGEHVEEANDDLPEELSLWN